MTAPSVAQRFAELDNRLSTGEYNFEHFHIGHILADVQRTLKRSGIQPGALAPDFELPRVGSGSLRLTALRDRPTLLRFGSFT